MDFDHHTIPHLYYLWQIQQILGNAVENVALIMSGGTEGGLSPHLVTFEALDETGNGPSMAIGCLLYTSPSPRDLSTSRMPSSA